MIYKQVPADKDGNDSGSDFWQRDNWQPVADTVQYSNCSRSDNRSASGRDLAGLRLLRRCT
jgi:hypothetical protein